MADPNIGVAVYDKYGSGGCTVFGGTSVASPLVASIFAATGHATAYGRTPWDIGTTSTMAFWGAFH